MSFLRHVIAWISFEPSWAINSDKNRCQEGETHEIIFNVVSLNYSSSYPTYQFTELVFFDVPEGSYSLLDANGLCFVYNAGDVNYYCYNKIGSGSPSIRSTYWF
ncbi:hypothetical protein ACU8KH_04783 [Lachancea thermotolerans]